MAYLRSEVVKLIKSWEGKKESDGSFKEIIDIYNSLGTAKLPRKIKMQYDWEWCACTWSALAIKLGYTKVMPIEISCGQLVEKAKKMGIWVEKDNYIPSPADAILFDWEDTGKGDDTGWPDHIGTVIEVNAAGGYFYVMEGNYSNSVKKRKMWINQKNIRGFITPKYDAEPKKETKPSTKKTKVVASECAQNKDNALRGTYKVTRDLHLRNGAGANKKSLYVLPKDTLVQNYGYYNLNGSTKWLYVTLTVNGVTYTGFSSSKYLKKQ